jgi:hypothetical protein
MKKHKKLVPIIFFLISAIIFSSYNIYFFNFKKFNEFEKEVDYLDSEEIRIFSKENEDILNYIDWDSAGYRIFNYNNKKIVYIRLWDEPCHPYETYDVKIKDNTLTLKMFKREYYGGCATPATELGERFWVMKNQNFDDVNIYMNYNFSLYKISKLEIQEEKNTRTLERNFGTWE